MARKKDDGLLLGPLLYPTGTPLGRPSLFSLRMHELDVEFTHQMKRLSRAMYRAKRSAEHKAQNQH